MLIILGKAEILKYIVLLCFDGIQLALPDSVKNKGIILDPTLLLEKQVNTVVLFWLSLAWKMIPYPDFASLAI